mmetsp:Transcript_7710/g.24155  ORF Transcript_7710/g.24155 Transcript_7710/m.24155 type:complete len:232 (-) Transcript_7710:183-878(-)
MRGWLRARGWLPRPPLQPVVVQRGEAVGIAARDEVLRQRHAGEHDPEQQLARVGQRHRPPRPDQGGRPSQPKRRAPHLQHELGLVAGEAVVPLGQRARPLVVPHRHLVQPGLDPDLGLQEAATGLTRAPTRRPVHRALDEAREGARSAHGRPASRVKPARPIELRVPGPSVALDQAQAELAACAVLRADAVNGAKHAPDHVDAVKRFAAGAVRVPMVRRLLKPWAGTDEAP